MDTRNLGYLGLAALVAIVLVTLIGVPPPVWLTAVFIIAGIGMTIVVLKAQADGTEDAERYMARSPRAPARTPTPSPVEVELVRPADGAGTSAVWLHRHGGRRVHRFATADGWVVQQVSTKDPDNPRKRVIGEPLLLPTEAAACQAADHLAQGVRPTESVSFAGSAFTTQAQA